MKRIKRLLTLAVVVAMLLCASAAYAFEPLNIGNTLELNDSGEDVAALQLALTETGFYTGGVSGYFDQATLYAVQSVQIALGLPITGAFDATTQSAFNGAYSPISIFTVPVGKLSGRVIGIDAGHQLTADETQEIIAPASTRTKAKMSEGCYGVKTGTQEYRITLKVAAKLKTLLENEGATVIMTRTRDDVTLSNMQRAQAMNNSGVNVWVRLHCNYSTAPAFDGVYVLVPSRSVTPLIYDSSLLFGKTLIKTFCESTGAKPRAIVVKADQTGFNWSNSPVATIEMGYLSNAAEDMKLSRDSYQSLCATGIYNGLISYFELQANAAGSLPDVLPSTTPILNYSNAVNNSANSANYSNSIPNTIR